MHHNGSSAREKSTSYPVNLLEESEKEGGRNRHESRIPRERASGRKFHGLLTWKNQERGERKGDHLRRIFLSTGEKKSHFRGPCRQEKSNLTLAPMEASRCKGPKAYERILERKNRQRNVIGRPLSMSA